MPPSPQGIAHLAALLLMHDHTDDYDGTEGRDEYPRDPAIDRAITRLRQFFDASPKRVFYTIQISTQLEREFFHWITGKALLEMANAGQIQVMTESIHGKSVHFYAHRGHRYVRREIAGMVDILNNIFDAEFTHALGRHGELMFDAALGRAGFQSKAKNARDWEGKTWTKSNHNLDRIVVKDSRPYGVEIKNTQNYISREELKIKLDLCRHLGLIPLFIVRFAPKSYIYEVQTQGGFTLLFEEQMYPFGQSALLSRVRSELGLKVHCPNDVKDGDIQRLLKWHDRQLRPR